jgi:hypothetical protein
MVRSGLRGEVALRELSAAQRQREHGERLAGRVRVVTQGGPHA